MRAPIWRREANGSKHTKGSVAFSKADLHQTAGGSARGDKAAGPPAAATADLEAATKPPPPRAAGRGRPRRYRTGGKERKDRVNGPEAALPPKRGRRRLRGPAATATATGPWGASRPLLACGGERLAAPPPPPPRSPPCNGVHVRGSQALQAASDNGSHRRLDQGRLTASDAAAAAAAAASRAPPTKGAVAHGAAEPTRGSTGDAKTTSGGVPTPVPSESELDDTIAERGGPPGAWRRGDGLAGDGGSTAASSGDGSGQLRNHCGVADRSADSGAARGTASAPGARPARPTAMAGDREGENGPGTSGR